MSAHLLTQTPCSRCRTDEIVKKCSATELVRAVEANINAQLPHTASHDRDNWAVVEARMASGRSVVRVRGMDLSRGLRR